MTTRTSKLLILKNNLQVFKKGENNMENKEIEVPVIPVIEEEQTSSVIKVSEEEIEKRNQELRKQEQQEIEENLKKCEKGKFALLREQIGEKTKGIKEAISKKSKKAMIGQGVVTVALAAALLITGMSSCKGKEKEVLENNMSTSTTDIYNSDESIENNEISVPIMSSTINSSSSTTSTSSSTTSTTSSSTTTKEEVSEPVESIIVTRPETTTSEPVETQPIETEEVQSSTTVSTEEKEPEIIETIEPIQINNLRQKEAILKEAVEKVGIVASEELIENTVRVLHSDFIEHDGLGEITGTKYEQVLSLLSSMGSVNEVTYNAGYMGYIPEITEGIYIPAEVFPETSQKMQEATIKISEAYRLGINKAPTAFAVEITSEEEQKLTNEVISELENIEDDNEHTQKFEEIYAQKYEKLYNDKMEKGQEGHDKEVEKEYQELYTTVIELVNSKEYENLTPSEKLGMFTNISGAMLSGMQERHISKYQGLQEGIGLSADEARAELVSQNRINQQQVLNSIVTNNKEVVRQEREDLKTIVDSLNNLYEEGKLLVR